jgi:hypothetical protein
MDEGNRAQRFLMDRLQPGGVLRLDDSYLEEIGNVRSDIRNDYYGAFYHVERCKKLVTDASNQSIIHNQFVHKNDRCGCNDMKAVTTVACLIPDESETREFESMEGTCYSYRSTQPQDHDVVFHYNTFNLKKKPKILRNLANQLVGRMMVSTKGVKIKFMDSGISLVDKFEVISDMGID